MRALAGTVSIGVCLVAALAALADDPKADSKVIELWPKQPPGELGKVPEEKVLPQKPDENPTIKRISYVSKPTLTVFSPPKEKASGAACIVCPGGGYRLLAWDLEGEEVATWLNSIGITAFVLKYRVPGRPKIAQHALALHDAQRAVSLLREQAGKWQIDPQKIGMLGFSAGGHLACAASTNFDRRGYPLVDATDKTSCRPDFAILVYPAYLVDKDLPDTLSPEIRVSIQTPPTFLVHALDDEVSPQNSLIFVQQARQKGVSAELHLYAKGGHGFGLRKSNNPCSTWPARCEEWLRSQGILKPNP